MKNNNRGFIGVALAIVLGLAALVSTGVFVYHEYQVEHAPQTLQNNDPSFSSINVVAGTIYYLYGSGIGTTDTSITLTSFKQPVNTYPLSMADFGDLGYLTLEPGNTSRQEFVSFTGVTQNGDGTATLTGVTRGLAFTSPFTASSTIRKAHAGGTTAVISNPPQFYERFAVKQNTQYVTGAWGFQGTAPTSTSCASPFELCNKAYVDATANAGAATSTEINGGIVELGTLAEQASSYDGGANKPTVLQTKNSTSTCQVVGTYNIVASSTTGRLDKGCFDQTANYNLTGNNTISSTTVTNLMVSNATTTGTNYYGNRLVQTPKFGGTGTDGALSVSSGVTTINVGTRSVVELNYTSVSITGTASLVFNSGVSATSTSGVQIIVRSQGDCTITSSSATAVDVRGLGGGMANGRQLGYTSGAVNPGGPGGGSTADSGENIVTGAAGGLGLGGVQLPALSSTTLQVLPGGNGIVGVSSGGGGAAGTFGRGGGGLYLECAGAYNFTTGTITAAGQNGGNGGSGGGNPGGSGGGGGGGGNILVRYGSLTANSGTYTITAGTAGTGGTGTSAGTDGSAGGAGSHLEVLNTYLY